MRSLKLNRLPPWFKIGIATSDRLLSVRSLIKNNKLHTVCQSAACPNQNECWNSGTATFLILGNICSRNCVFCNIPKGTPERLDPDEPDRVAHAVAVLNLNYAVITSVTRDDLDDGGALMFADTMRAIRRRTPGCRIEVLIPDFQGSGSALRMVLDEKPDVLNHNIETVPSLYPRIRPRADYRRSLELLSRAHDFGALTKTGFMLGLGEEIDEVHSLMKDLRRAGCEMLTIGQYLRPSKTHLPVVKYYRPDEFDAIHAEAFTLGFRQVVAGPLVRSSYHAEQYCRRAEASE